MEQAQNNGGGFLSGIAKPGGFLSGLFQAPEIPEIESVEPQPTDYTPVYVLSAVFVAAIVGAFFATKPK